MKVKTRNQKPKTKNQKPKTKSQKPKTKKPTTKKPKNQKTQTTHGECSPVSSVAIHCQRRETA
jgi:hypothetical protein